MFEPRSVDKYPDVQASTLAWAVFQGVLLCGAGLALLLPDSALAVVLTWWKASTGLDAGPLYGAAGTLGALASWFAVGKVKVQRLWDRRVSKWRRRHELEFLLPELLRPLRHRVDSRLIERAGREIDELGESRTVQSLFENVITKAHDRLPHMSMTSYLASLASYWELRVSELFVAVFTAVVLFVAGISSVAGVEASYWREMFWLLAASVVVNGAVLAITGNVRHRVRKNALILIRDIHERCPDLLVDELVRLQADLPVLTEPAMPTRSVLPQISLFGSDRIDNDVFYATPMASVSPEEYARSFHKHMPIIQAMRLRGLSVFWAGEQLPTADRFEDEGEALQANLRVLRRSVCFVLVWPSALCSSALIELGYCLALNRSGLILVTDSQKLPFLARGIVSCFPDSFRIARYRDFEDVISLTSADLPDRVQRGRQRLGDP